MFIKWVVFSRLSGPLWPASGPLHSFSLTEAGVTSLLAVSWTSVRHHTSRKPSLKLSFSTQICVTPSRVFPEELVTLF